MSLPQMPDVTNLLDNVQESIQTINIPKPPSAIATGQFFVDIINRVTQRLGVAAPFPTPISLPGVLPQIPAGLPRVPQVPKTARPFRLPF